MGHAFGILNIAEHKNAEKRDKICSMQKSLNWNKDSILMLRINQNKIVRRQNAEQLKIKKRDEREHRMMRMKKLMMMMRRQDMVQMILMMRVKRTKKRLRNRLKRKREESRREVEVQRNDL